VVEVDEVVHNSNEKVIVDGALEFKFNVPISKYSSDTSEIHQSKSQTQ